MAFVLPDGRSAFIEIKKPGGRLSPEQKTFEAMLRNRSELAKALFR